MASSLLDRYIVDDTRRNGAPARRGLHASRTSRRKQAGKKLILLPPHIHRRYCKAVRHPTADGSSPATGGAIRPPATRIYAHRKRCAITRRRCRRDGPDDERCRARNPRLPAPVWTAVAGEMARPVHHGAAREMGGGTMSRLRSTPLFDGRAKLLRRVPRCISMRASRGRRGGRGAVPHALPK